MTRRRLLVTAGVGLAGVLAPGKAPAFPDCVEKARLGP